MTVSIAISILIMPLFATCAVFIGLWLTGIELNITAMMGMTMIIGIVTEVAIFFFSEFDDLRRVVCRSGSAGRSGPQSPATNCHDHYRRYSDALAAGVCPWPRLRHAAATRRRDYLRIGCAAPSGLSGYARSLSHNLKSSAYAVSGMPTRDAEQARAARDDVATLHGSPSMLTTTPYHIDETAM